MTESQDTAYLILKAFEKSYRRFMHITSDAKSRFEQRDWHSARIALKLRINQYEQSLLEVVKQFFEEFTPSQKPKQFWIELKQSFLGLVNDHPQSELAETFYNSVIGRLFQHQELDNDIMFVLPSRCYVPGLLREKILNHYSTEKGFQFCLRDILTQTPIQQPFVDLDRDINRIIDHLRECVAKDNYAQIEQIEMVKPVFYRAKAAYLVGRLVGAEKPIPFVIALMNNSKGQIYVDTVLSGRSDISILFGFARSYFMVESVYPAEIVSFLLELMPNKKYFELYSALGHNKHGKTVFYRNFLKHMDESDDQFDIAPGIPGLVMSVFHLPSYGVVFKVIKDEFGESKYVTPQQVKEKYRLVKMHDRVGRMADTHEYINFRLPLARVSPALLQELQAVAAKSIEVTQSELVIKHLYIERRMTPLNLYLQREEDPLKLSAAVEDLGQCIKEIAAANIFPGDMLHKNFGITRHGRVIFYDYDEICYLQERNFRDLPTSDDPYAMDCLSVAPDDVFPAQFEHFILGKRELKQQLKQMHPELMQPEYWRELQKIGKRSGGEDTLPYKDHQRFIRIYGNACQTNNTDATKPTDQEMLRARCQLSK